MVGFCLALAGVVELEDEQHNRDEMKPICNTQLVVLIATVTGNRKTVGEQFFSLILFSCWKRSENDKKYMACNKEA